MGTKIEAARPALEAAKTAYDAHAATIPWSLAERTPEMMDRTWQLHRAVLDAERAVDEARIEEMFAEIPAYNGAAPRCYSCGSGERRGDPMECDMFGQIHRSCAGC